MKVLRIEIIPTGADWTLKPLGPYEDNGRNEYVPEANDLRTDLKRRYFLQSFDHGRFNAETTVQIGANDRMRMRPLIRDPEEPSSYTSRLCP